MYWIEHLCDVTDTIKRDSWQLLSKRKVFSLLHTAQYIIYIAYYVTVKQFIVNNI